MSMKDILNKQLQGIAAKMADIESRADKGEAKGDDLESYKSLVAEGKTVREQLDTVEAADALKSWMKGSDGNSAARQSFSQELTDPADREQEQRAQEAGAKNAYKSAFESYLRNGMKIGPQDKKILMEGAIKSGDAMKVLTEGSAQGGGYTVPEQFVAEVLKKEPGLMGLNDNVRTVPTTRDVICWPIIRYSTSNVYTAPHRLTWTGEIPAAATTARVTDQTFGEVRIPINVAMASQLISNTLVEDSAIDIMGLTAQIFRENIMQDIEAALVSGTGSGQPEGIFTNGRARADTIVTGAAAQITTGGLLRLYWNVPAQYRKNAKWLMNSFTAYNVASLTDNNARFMWNMSGFDMGGGLATVQQDGVVTMQPKLLGMPVVLSEQCTNMTTNAYCIAFGDLKGYIKAERVGMTVRVLDEIYAETDQKLYLLRYRCGGQLAEDYKVRLQRCQA